MKSGIKRFRRGARQPIRIECRRGKLLMGKIKGVLYVKEDEKDERNERYAKLVVF